MFFDEPMILHSVRDDGRHWLTSMDLPPLQILPAEGNQCRVAHSLALLLSAKLSDEEAQEELDLPCELALTRADLERVVTTDAGYDFQRAAGLLAFNSAGKDRSENSVIYFVGIDNARFKRPVVPGDQLRLEARITKNIRGIWKFETRALVGEQLACEADLMCTLRDLD